MQNVALLKLYTNRNRPFSSRLQFFCAFIKSIKSTYFLRWTAFKYFIQRQAPTNDDDGGDSRRLFSRSTFVVVSNTIFQPPLREVQYSAIRQTMGVRERMEARERGGMGGSMVQIYEIHYSDGAKKMLVYVLFTWNRCALLAAAENLVNGARATSSTR